MSATEDLFVQGFDRCALLMRSPHILLIRFSLHATFMRNRIIGAMRSSSDETVQKAAARVSSNFVFEHPTLQSLADAIVSLVDPSSIETARDTIQEVTNMINKYAVDLPHPVSAEPSRREIVVLLTGSTGNIGSSILAALLTHPRVHKVYTLNRTSSTSVAERQTAAFVEHKFPVELLADPKLRSLTGDVSSALDGAAAQEVRRQLSDNLQL